MKSRGRFLPQEHNASRCADIDRFISPGLRTVAPAGAAEAIPGMRNPEYPHVLIGSPFRRSRRFESGRLLNQPYQDKASAGSHDQCTDEGDGNEEHAWDGKYKCHVKPIRLWLAWSLERLHHEPDTAEGVHQATRGHEDPIRPSGASSLRNATACRLVDVHTPIFLREPFGSTTYVHGSTRFWLATWPLRRPVKRPDSIRFDPVTPRRPSLEDEEIGGTIFRAIASSDCERLAYPAGRGKIDTPWTDQLDDVSLARQWRCRALADPTCRLRSSFRRSGGANLRRTLSPSRAHLSLEQVALRHRAALKFEWAGKMFFTGTGLEQATDAVDRSIQSLADRAGSVCSRHLLRDWRDLLSFACAWPGGRRRHPPAWHTLLAEANARALER